MSSRDHRPIDPEPSEHHPRDIWEGLGHFVEGLVYPARPVDMIRHAEQQRHSERIHREILERVKKLPDKEFQSPEEVHRHLDDTH